MEGTWAPSFSQGPPGMKDLEDCPGEWASGIRSIKGGLGRLRGKPLAAWLRSSPRLFFVLSIALLMFNFW